MRLLLVAEEIDRLRIALPFGVDQPPVLVVGVGDPTLLVRDVAPEHLAVGRGGGADFLRTGEDDRVLIQCHRGRRAAKDILGVEIDAPLGAAHHAVRIEGVSHRLRPAGDRAVDLLIGRCHLVAAQCRPAAV